MRFFLCAALLILAPSTALAGKVITWRHAARTDWEAGRLANVAVGPAGVSLTRKLEPLADLKAGSVWDLVRTPQGKLLAATAEPGQVVEVDADGKTKVLWKDDAVQTFSLAALADGALLAGTGPEGKVFKLDAAGKATEFARLDALYVWDLLPGPDGSVYAATGPKGKIFKLAADGTATVFHETKQQHVLALAAGPQGQLFAGTDGPGLVLSIDPRGAGRVLLDCGGADARALAVIGQSLYVGTAGTGSTGSSLTSTSSATTRTTPNSVYRIDPSGAALKLFTTPAMFFALAGCDGEVLAGSGPQGQLYALADTDARQLAKLDVEQILTLTSAAAGGLIVGTGGPAKLFRLSPEYAPQGTLTSQPLDAKLIARYGSLTWSADAPAGTAVTVAVRSGNTAQPGDDWSAWSEEQADPDQAQAACPAGRFVQYRVTLSAKDARLSPQLRSVSLRYRTANQPPAINTLVTPHVEEADGKKALTTLKLTWTAADPNQDDLTYALEFRKSEWNTWVKLKDGLTKPEYEWDVTSVPAGEYRVRLTASDAASNPADEALTDVRISEPFTVDCQPPAVEARLVEVRASEAPPAAVAAGQVKGGFVATLEAKAVDRHSPIVAASYALDSGEWVNIFPIDKLFDSPSERFRFDVPELAPGLHVLVVRATDAAGHTASADVVFAAGEQGVKLAK